MLAPRQFPLAQNRESLASERLVEDQEPFTWSQRLQYKFLPVTMRKLFIPDYHRTGTYTGRLLWTGSSCVWLSLYKGQTLSFSPK